MAKAGTDVKQLQEELQALREENDQLRQRLEHIARLADTDTEIEEEEEEEDLEDEEDEEDEDEDEDEDDEEELDQVDLK